MVMLRMELLPMLTLMLMMVNTMRIMLRMKPLNLSVWICGW